jgi:pimeloyl-ACP methyl ester carboxylesterase
MPKLKLNGLEFRYESTGPENAPTVVFLHGRGAERSSFRPQVVHLEESHRVINWDLRGHGESAGHPASFSVKEFASDTLELISSLNLKNVVLVGNGFGALIAQEVSSRDPDHVSGTVLIDAPAEAEETRSPKPRLLISHVEAPATVNQLIQDFVANVARAANPASEASSSLQLRSG